MAKCGICGLDVVVGDVFHRDCIMAELEMLREENAALRETVKRLDLDCSECARALTPAPCEESDYLCWDCPHDCICRDCRDNSKWVWKGAPNV